MNKISTLTPITPPYLHREFANDIKPAREGTVFSNSCARIALVALPFISLYKPAGFPLSLGMGGLRVVSNLTALYEATKKGATSEISCQMLQTAVSIASVAGTIMAHPLGAMISTGHDLAIKTVDFAHHLYDCKYTKAAEDFLHIANETIYLGLFVTSSAQLAIASLGLQILIELYHSQKEFKNGKYLEGCAHFIMAGIHCKQMEGAIGQMQKQMQENLTPSITQPADTIKQRNKMQEDPIHVIYLNPDKYESNQDALRGCDYQKEFEQVCNSIYRDTVEPQVRRIFANQQWRLARIITGEYSWSFDSQPMGLHIYVNEDGQERYRYLEFWLKKA